MPFVPQQTRYCNKQYCTRTIAKSQKQKETAKDAKKQESQIAVFLLFQQTFPLALLASLAVKK